MARQANKQKNYQKNGDRQTKRLTLIWRAGRQKYGHSLADGQTKQTDRQKYGHNKNLTKKEGQTDRQTKIWTNKQTNRRADKHMQRQADKPTDYQRNKTGNRQTKLQT